MTGYAKMAEGRKSQVILLDDRRLDIIIQPKLYSSDLLDLVASHFKLREKHYFGLGFVDETYHFNWLQGEKRVLDHDFPKKTGLLVLHFAIRFYVETIGLLRDTQTVELFYLNARQAVFRSQIECDVNTVFELAAHVLQATNGDFVSEEETREELKKLPVIPTSTLKAHPSIGFCEDQVIEHYTKLCGSSRGLAIVNYMTIVEQLPTYGIHYYDVKDKKDIPWWLGISPRGIAVYDKNDKTTPRKLFTWKDLENLYYRDKKFSIEVHGPKREETCSHIVHTLSSFNPYEDAVREPVESYDDLSSAITDPTTQVSVSRRTFGASNVDVHAWFASTNQLTKCIWSMAVAQHQFYLDRKQSKSQLPTARSMSEIAADLCRSTTSLPGSLGSDLSRSPSSHSLPSLSNSRYDLTIEQSDSLKAERDMYAALLARREALEDALKKKLEELRAVCLQEGELTGDLPPELPLARGEQPPVFRRRVGTAFTLSAKKVQDTDQLSTELAQLELEVELQGKITSAAQRLASDKTVSKFVRKQRRQSYTKAVGKLKDMEKKLGDMRKQAGRNSSSQATVSQSPSRIFEGMYSVLDTNPTTHVMPGDDLLTEAAASDVAAETITARSLHGNLPHRFQHRGKKKQNHGDDQDSVHSGDSGVTSGVVVVASTPPSSSSSSTSLVGYSLGKPSSSGSLASSSGASICRCGSNIGGNVGVSSGGTLVGRRLASVASAASSSHDQCCRCGEDSASVDSGAPSVDDAYSGCSQDLRDLSSTQLSCGAGGRRKTSSASDCTDEDSSSGRGGRTKHFVVSRGPQRSRFKEVGVIGRRGSQPSDISIASVARLDSELNLSVVDPVAARLARAEADDEFDTACNASQGWDNDDDDNVEDESSKGACDTSSFGDDTSFCAGADSETMEEYQLWREEQSFTTRVQRRKQTVILSRSLRRRKPDDIERGYKAFENIYLGGYRSAGLNSSNVSVGETRGRQLCRAAGRNQSLKRVSEGEMRRDSQSNNGRCAELDRKVQDLIDSCQGGDDRPGRRSRSFDSSHDSRITQVGGARSSQAKVNQTSDDIRLSSKKSTSTLSSTAARKSSGLFSKLKQKYTKDVTSETYVGNTTFNSELGYESDFSIVAGNIRNASGETCSSRLAQSTSFSVVGRVKQSNNKMSCLRPSPSSPAVVANNVSFDSDSCSSHLASSSCSTTRNSSSSSSGSEGGYTTPTYSSSKGGGVVSVKSHSSTGPLALETAV